MKLNNILTLSLVAFMSTSCGLSTPKVDAKNALEKANETIKAPPSWSNQELIRKASQMPIEWLDGFNDPIMMKLVQEGRKNNNNLKVAAANMDISWLMAEKSGSALKPSVDVSLSGAKTGTKNGSSDSANLGVKLGWEVDVWGRIQNGVDAATASAQAAEADYKFAQESLSANIAKTYLKVIDAKLQAKLIQQNLTILKKTMRITQLRYDNGLSSGQDIALNRANLASAKEQLIKIEGSKRNALRSLELLLGRYPDASIEIPNILPTLPSSPPAGLPSELLQRRPDLVSAERSVAAAYDMTAQAQAARLPQFALTTTLSEASSDLSKILNPANLTWQLAANIVAPIYDGGRRKIDVEISTKKQEQAVTSYVQTALEAFSDVETNLDQGRVLAKRETALEEVLKHSKKAYRIANFRYKEGEIGLLDTLQIQQQTITAQSNLISVKRLELEQRINLYLALGGKW